MFRWKLEIAAKMFAIFILPCYLLLAGAFLFVIYKLATLPMPIVFLDADQLTFWLRLMFLPAAYITAVGAWSYACRQERDLMRL